jgi:hypothetical protein
LQATPETAPTAASSVDVWSSKGATSTLLFLTHLHDCLCCLQELAVDLQPALLDGAAQLAACCWRVVVVDARQRAERVDDIRRLCLDFKDLQRGL